ncbi:MAG: PEP-CTERM-box response regulator transcription factor [Burkholderiaceae bacterium]|nr:PEP-CTERM-box response regulator transcription factor [Burkholderiaceae bacterium]
MSGKRPPLLIVEDDVALQMQMKWALDAYEPATAVDADEAMTQVRRIEPAVVTLDLGLPPSPDDPSVGLDLLQRILAEAPDTKVIVVTGQSDRAHALRAVALGAYDFLTKPFEPEVLALTIERAFRLHALQQENRRLQAAQMTPALAGILTRDPAMMRLCRTLEKVAPTNVTLLIHGESGTGKELFARGAHEASGRRNQRFVAINCAAIPENLLESELFGYEKGAFTGAVKQTPGKIETAHKGTLFLDEIGDLPLSLQAKLLRFLQERRIERLGGREEIAVDVRVVCATHRDLKALTADGRFCADLYSRLAEIVLEVPPLRARAGDASLLAHAFVHRFAAELKRGSMTLAPDAIEAIERHRWPGNVRELENLIKRAVVMAEDRVIRAADLGLATDGESENLNLRAVRDEAERQALLKALGRANNNLSRAADLLGVSRPTLYDLMHRFGLK